MDGQVTKVSMKRVINKVITRKEKKSGERRGLSLESYTVGSFSDNWGRLRRGH